jgi:transcriptional regulator with XRE-family HTH domain
MSAPLDPSQETQKALSNIKKFRELKSITREQIASDLEMSASGYSKIERGEIELTLSRLYQIAGALEVKVSQILNFDVQNIFNIAHGQGISGDQTSGTYYYYSDNHTEKYIKKLEEEIDRLKKEAKADKSD